MSRAIQPELGLYASSLFILVLSAIGISTGIAALTVLWDPCSLVSGVGMLGFFSLIGACQYAGTFRGHEGAAAISGALHFGVGCLAGVSLVVTAGELLLSGELRLTNYASLLIPMLATCGVFMTSGLLNWRWYRRLEARRLTGAAGAPSDRNDALRFSVREMLLGIALIGVVTALATYFVRTMPPRFAEHVSADRAPLRLPPEATDVCFCRGMRGRLALEFDIDEPGFRRWVDDEIRSRSSSMAKVRPHEIVPGQVIHRYGSIDFNLGALEEVTIPSGLRYFWMERDNSIEAAFDRTTSRAYYFCAGG